MNYLEEIRNLKKTIEEYKSKEAFFESQLSYLEELFESTQDSIVVSNSKHEIVKVNKSFLNLFGYSLEGVIGRSIDSLITMNPDTASAVDLTQKAESGEELFFEGIRTKKDGSKVSVAVKVTPIEYKKERVGYHGVYRDISLRKEAEQKLEINTEYFEQLFESTPEAIVLTDTNYRIVKANPEFFRLFKYSEEELVGNLIQDLIVPGYLKEEFKELNQNIGTGKRPYLETIRVDKNGTELEVSILASSIELNGRAIGGFGIYRDIQNQKQMERELKEAYVDLEERVKERTEELSQAIQKLNLEITERKRTEKELWSAKEQAEQANQLKTNFLANMSHEIRTPMNAIYGAAGIFQDSELTTDQQKYMNIIRISTEALLELINDILDLSKIEAEKLNLENIPFYFSEIMDKVTKMLSNKASLKRLEFNQSISPEIPESLIGDPGRIKQILINLLNNALKFTDSGSVTLEAVLNYRKGDEISLNFKIIDTGIGIDKDKQVEIFNSFSQVDTSTTRKYGGTGLGLSIAKKLVEKMGGKLGLKSKKDEGAEFYFDLILKTKKMETKEVPKINKKDTEVNILLVEDNQINRKLALHYLKKFGYNTDVAVDGVEAVSKLEEKIYDLVLLDIQMPRKDGFEVAEIIRDKNSKILDHEVAIIAMTAHAMKGDKMKCLDAGMDDYLSKPIKTDILKEKILNNLKKKSSE